MKNKRSRCISWGVHLQAGGMVDPDSQLKHLYMSSIDRGPSSAIVFAIVVVFEIKCEKTPTLTNLHRPTRIGHGKTSTCPKSGSLEHGHGFNIDYNCI
jgi:hypothetical protein